MTELDIEGASSESYLEVSVLATLSLRNLLTYTGGQRLSRRQLLRWHYCLGCIRQGMPLTLSTEQNESRLTSIKDSWRSSTSPLLFDSNYQAKDAYNAIINAL